MKPSLQGELTRSGKLGVKQLQRTTVALEKQRESFALYLESFSADELQKVQGILAAWEADPHNVDSPFAEACAGEIEYLQA